MAQVNLSLLLCLSFMEDLEIITLGIIFEKAIWDELKAIDIKTQLYFKLEDRKLMSAHEEDQYPLRKKDGSRIWVEDHSNYEYDEQGNILFHRGILRDVTSKVERQNEL